MAGPSTFCDTVGQFLARRFPPAFANAGDSVGLTVGTLRDAEKGDSAVVLLCVDLTEQVLAEAISCHANVIIAYSPIPSEPIRSLRIDDPVGRILLGCAQHNIAAHCLHSACANAPGGAVEWLATQLARGHTRPIVANAEHAEAGQGRLLECEEPVTLATIITQLKAVLGVRHLRIALGQVVVDEHNEQNVAQAMDTITIKSIGLQVHASLDCRPCAPQLHPPDGTDSRLSRANRWARARRSCTA